MIDKPLAGFGGDLVLRKFADAREVRAWGRLATQSVPGVNSTTCGLLN